MISALYAKKQTDKAIERNKYIESEKIFDKIKDAINEGMYFVTIDYIIPVAIISKLVELGYKVRDCSNVNNCRTLISWDEIEES